MSFAKSESKKTSLPQQLKRWRVLLFFAVAGLLTLIAVLPQFSSFNFFYAVEQSALSLRFLLRGMESPAEDAAKIVIVAVDDRSLYPEISKEDLALHPQLEILQQGWAWNRSIHGFIAKRLFEAGASVVAYDFIFPTPNAGDFEFYEALEPYIGSVVLGFDYVPSENELGETSVKERLPYDDLLPLSDEDFLQFIGFVNIERDQDGVLRQAKISTNIYAENQRFIDDPVQYQRVSTLAQRTDKVLSLGAQAAVLKEPSVRSRIPALFEAPAINYGGLDYFPTISAIDLILEDRYAAYKESLQGAVVFVGPYSDFFKDVVTTPLGDMFGVETHAHLARSLLNDSFYLKLPIWYQRGLVLLLALVLLWGNLRLSSALQKGAWTTTLWLGYVVLSQIAFVQFNWILPVAGPLFMILLGGGMFLLFDFALSQYERRRLKGYLSRYVSPEVANLLSDDSTELEAVLRGANRSIAVMFSDIRGFTTLSEQYSPEELVEHLNEYFESMVDSIHHDHGSLNKYIGDAILAFWGGIFSAGPKQDCLNCLASALDMQQRMQQLNEAWVQQEGRLPLQVGIGISFGQGFVGNLGHSQRMEFAVMGDVVNLGSRLEGATKQYGCDILVSEPFYLQCRDDYHFQELDIIQVKGKTSGIRVFTPVCAVSEVAPVWLSAWEQVLQDYRGRNFTKAREQFSQLADLYPNLKTAAQLYVERCRQLELAPPPEDWDCVYVMQTK